MCSRAPSYPLQLGDPPSIVGLQGQPALRPPASCVTRRDSCCELTLTEVWRLAGDRSSGACGRRRQRVFERWATRRSGHPPNLIDCNASVNGWKIAKAGGGVLQAQSPEGQNAPFFWPVHGRNRSKFGQGASKLIPCDHPLPIQDGGEESQPVAMRLGDHLVSEGLRIGLGPMPLTSLGASEPHKQPSDHGHELRSINRHSRDG